MDVDFVDDGTVADADCEFLFNGAPMDVSHWNVHVSSIVQSGADFCSGYGGSTDGRVMAFEVTEMQTVPEPGSMVLCKVAASGYLSPPTSTNTKKSVAGDRRCRCFRSDALIVG